jgi:hypothetical protein
MGPLGEIGSVIEGVDGAEDPRRSIRYRAKSEVIGANDSSTAE